MDTYGAGLSVMVIALFELVAIMWGYGVNNFCKDLRSMLGFSPSWYFKVKEFPLSFQCIRLLQCSLSFAVVLVPSIPSCLDHHIHCWMCRLEETFIWGRGVSGLGSYHWLDFDVVVCNTDPSMVHHQDLHVFDRGKLQRVESIQASQIMDSKTRSGSK